MKCCRMSNKHKGKRRIPPYKRGSAQPHSSNLIQIPGYYYDTSTNRFYKQQPSSSVKRDPQIYDLQKEARLHCPASLSKILFSRSLGNITNREFQRKSYLISAYEQKKRLVSTACHRGTVTNLQLTTNQDVLLAAVTSANGANLWKYTINTCKKFYLHIERDTDFMFSPSSEVTDVCLVRTLEIALMSSLGGPGTPGQVSALNLDTNRFVCNHAIPRGNVWSSCWIGDTTPSKICIGTSREAIVQHLGDTSRTLQTLHTQKSDVFCARANSSGNTVFTGTRNSQLICHDLRQKAPIFTLAHQSSVGDIRLLGCEYCVISSAYNGQVVQWDTRNLRHVVSYKGHVNDFARLKIKVDESESLLFIPGNDLYTRIWCLKSGELLNSLPPPAHDTIISNHNIPAVEVGLNWGGHYPGFAIAATGLLHWYSL